MKAFTAILSCSLLIAGVSAANLRQATRTEVQLRQRWADIFERQGNDVTSSACICPDNVSQCPLVSGSYCYEECTPDEGGTYTGFKRSVETPAPAPNDRGYKPKKSSFFVPAWQFTGDLLSPADVAAYLIGDGDWLHTNGTFMTDHLYKKRNLVFREHRWKTKAAKKDGIWTRIKQRAVNVTFRGLAGSLVRHFTDPNDVFVLSSDYGFKTTDLIRAAKLVYDHPSDEDVVVLTSVIPQSMIKTIIDTLCPRMGPEFCDF